MLVYAGIDEAGYGPLLGPLVIVRSTFVLEEKEPSIELPSLWELLNTSVCRNVRDKKHRIAVEDSKKLYTPSVGLRHLERGVLSFLRTNGIAPENLNHLLQTLAFDELSFRLDIEWYNHDEGCQTLPMICDRGDLDKDAGRLTRSLLRSRCRLVDLNAAVVFEDRFNRLIRKHRSKAGCAWNFVSGHLSTLWHRFGLEHPTVVVDRQGGRKDYSHLLALLFPMIQQDLIYEKPGTSCYRITEGERMMHVIFQVNGEACHFPVALASMTAKYVRELLMNRFQHYWRIHAPDVKSTFGYFKDGRRFLEEIQPVLEKMDIDRDKLIRCR